MLAANFVTIDLSGFTITGDGTGIGIAPDHLPGRRGHVVRNGTVTNFRRGVDLSNTQDAVIEGINAADNAEIGIGGGFSSIVKGNIARGTREVGIFALEGSIVTGNVAINTTKGPQSFGNGIVGARGTLVSGNMSFGNAGFGIFVTCPSNVTGNTVVSNSAGNLVLNPASSTGCNLTNNAAP